jgi:hypothetical protein
MDILEIVKNYSRKAIQTEDMKKFHIWILSQDGPMFRVLNDCCKSTGCQGRTCDIGGLTFKTQGHYASSLSVKFIGTDDSTYVVLNTDVG